MIDLFGKITDLLKPVTGLVDSLHTSDAERLEAKQKLLALQTEIIKDALALDREAMEAQASIIRAEAESEHWLTSTWRPLTMLGFVAVVLISTVASWFGASVPIPAELWPLIKLGLGGYVIGRSAEKTIPTTVAALKQREEA